MAKLSKLDLTKVNSRTGQLKYWWSFIESIHKGEAFRLGAQGEKGSVVIASNNRANTNRMLVAMRRCITTAQVRRYLDSRGYELPKAGGGTVKVTEIWKESVKETPSTGTEAKIGGRETEIYSEILAQFCLAYAIHYGDAASIDNCMEREGDKNVFKTDVFNSCKKYCITPSTFNLNNNSFKEKLALFASLPLGKTGSEAQEVWINTQGLAMLKLKNEFSIKKSVKIYNDKLFDGGQFTANPYLAYLKANTGVGTDKWNPADMWVMTPKGVQDLVHLNRVIKTRTKLSVNVANNFLMEQFRSGDIIPVSLKKPSVPAHIVTMNSDEYFERIVLGATGNPTVEITSDNKDVKINFTLETIKLTNNNRGLKGLYEARKRGQNISGQVVSGSQKHIRIKYHVNNKKIELEYTQTGQPSLARAKMGSLGNTNFTRIINETAKEGVRKLNTIQSKYTGRDSLNLNTGSDWFNGQLDRTLDDAKYGLLQQYVDELWQGITGDNGPNYAMIDALNNVSKLSSKAMAAEFGMSIAGVSNSTIQKRLITTLYEACASVAFGSGLTKEERELLSSNDGEIARKTKFHSSVHVKVY